ncbi:MAG: saccharopine dehydrogenase C-terminal domain-containing protein [Acidobacteriota bacterium]
MKIIVLGAGLVGFPMAVDLSKDKNFNVTLVDIDKEKLGLSGKFPEIKTKISDLSVKKNILNLVKDQDMVINAVPGFMGFETLRTIIEAKKDVVDIAFFPEDPFLLDELAKENGVRAVVDCGVAPGMSNMFSGYIEKKFDEIDSLVIYVGGLIEERKFPFEYKAVFSPVDVIEEYTRPARIIENGNLVIKEPLTEAELIEFPGVGTLEAFNSDGLRTLAYTIKGKDMKEKTLRYPGHIDKIILLKKMGFFETEKIDFNGCSVSPLDMSVKVIIPQWKFEESDRDITVMRIVFEGTEKGEKKRYTYDLYDRFDAETGTHSMARTTGYTATVTARLLAEGLYTREGISPPEFIGRENGCIEFVLNRLKDRGIEYTEKIESL